MFVICNTDSLRASVKLIVQNLSLHRFTFTTVLYNMQAVPQFFYYFNEP